MQGPFFSNYFNSDARILDHQLENNLDDIADWFQENDIFLVDRGYRDAIPLLDRLGIQGLLPAIRRPGEAQLSTEDGNTSRLITKCRWVVESRNGHDRSIFKFFDHIIEKAHAIHLRDFYLIASGILNRYHGQILMIGVDDDLARRMRERANEPNRVKELVDERGLRARGGDWVRLDAGHVPHFPRITEEQLRELTFGTYQIKLAPSYVQDKMTRDRDDEFQLDTRNDDPQLIRVRVYSRFTNRLKHQIFITFDHNQRPSGAFEVDVYALITGYYCTCLAGARTLGCCGHVTSVIWFLSYARHQENIKWPNNALLDNVLDAQ